MRGVISSWASLLAAMILSLAPAASGQEAPAIVAGPYLQLAEPDSVWVLWETTSGEESLVDWGETEALDRRETGDSLVTVEPARVHQVHLRGLEPGTTYRYRVTTGEAQSEIHRLTTPRRPEAEAPLRLVVMSDTQLDSGNPAVLSQVVEAGIMGLFQERFGPNLDQELALVMVAGDLVSDGRVQEQWRSDFFRPLAPLSASVPLMPVLGNHEHFAAHFFTYFHLPSNGVPGFEEHWWRHDLGNLRIIGLDSNIGPFGVGQVDFFEEALEGACEAPEVDFVLAQLHHPQHSELWPVGENTFSGDVVQALSSFSERCGKPSVLFFGHTHGYSRGQSRDQRHLMVNVATASGNIDYWGEYDQIDYEELTLSQDEWGFVVVEVEAGDRPQLTLTRISRGNEATPRDNEVRDLVTLRRDDGPPATPTALFPRGAEINPRCSRWQASAFSDPDGDAHQATQWQLGERCDQLEEQPFIDRWRQGQNWFAGVDTQEGDDLTDEELRDLEAGQRYCWRVRYRDDGLSWSQWSEPVTFSTRPEGVTDECQEPGPIIEEEPDADVDQGPEGDAAQDGATTPPSAAGGGGCQGCLSTGRSPRLLRRLLALR